MGAGGVQQVKPAGIAIEHLITILAQHLDLACILLEDGGADAVAVQQTPHDLTETAEAGDDDRVLHQLRLLVLRQFTLVAIVEPGLDHPIVEDQQQRRQRHGERHHQRQQGDGIPGSTLFWAANENSTKANSRPEPAPARRSSADSARCEWRSRVPSVPAT